MGLFWGVYFYVTLNNQREVHSQRLAEANEALLSSLRLQKRSRANARLSSLHQLIASRPDTAHQLLNDAANFPEDSRSFAWQLLNQHAHRSKIEIPSEDGDLGSIRFGGDDSLVATIGWSRILRVRDLRRPRRLFIAKDFLRGSQIRISPSDKAVFAVKHAGGIEQRRLPDGRVLRVLAPDTLFSGLIDLSPDGSRLVAVTRGKTDPANSTQESNEFASDAPLRELVEFNLPDISEKRARLSTNDRLTGLWYHSDGQMITAATHRGTLLSWFGTSLQSRPSQKLSDIDMGAGPLKYAVFSNHLADGSGLLVTAENTMAKYIRFDAPRQSLVGHIWNRNEGFTGATFLPPNRCVV